MSDSHRKASVAFIMLVVVIDTLGMGLSGPVLPQLIESMSKGDEASGARNLGWYTASYALMQFVFSPIIGGLSDRFGRRVVLLTSLVGVVLDYAMLVFAPTMGWLFVARLFGGMTGASISTAVAYMTDVTPPEKRAATFGLIGAAFGVGFIVGPALGGLLGGYNLRAPFVAALVMSFVSLVYGLFVLPESLAKENRRPFVWKRSNPLGAFKSLARSRILFGLTIAIVLLGLGEQAFGSTWALYTERRFGWSPRGVGLSMCALGAATAFVQAWLLPRINTRLGERSIVLAGLFSRIVSYVVFGLAAQAWLFYLSIALCAFGGAVDPALRGMLTSEVGPDEQGELQGSVSSVMSLVSIVAPIMGTTLFATFAPLDAQPRILGATAFAAALLVSGSLACTLQALKTRRLRQAR